MKQNYTFEIAQFSLKEDLLTKAYLKTCNRYGLEEIPFHLNCHLQIPFAIGLGSSCGFSRGSFISFAKIVHKKKIDKAEVLQDALVLKITTTLQLPILIS